MTRFLASFGCALFLSAFSPCQISSSLSTGPNGMHGTLHFQAPFYRAAITGAPYSAEKVDEHIQTLADGTHITQTFPETKVYRDSVGRTREEHPAFLVPIERHADAPKSPTVVEINDPVAHVRYVFILEETAAHRQELPDSPQRASTRAQTSDVAMSGATGAAAPSTGARHGADDATRPQMTTEDLGTQIIEGMQAEGKRHTTTWPVGAVGNDRPSPRRLRRGDLWS